MRPWISRSAVSCEHCSSVAHVAVVSFPVKPSEAVQQAVDHIPLPGVHLHARGLPAGPEMTCIGP